MAISAFDFDPVDSALKHKPAWKGLDLRAGRPKTHRKRFLQPKLPIETAVLQTRAMFKLHNLQCGLFDLVPENIAERCIGQAWRPLAPVCRQHLKRGGGRGFQIREVANALEQFPQDVVNQTAALHRGDFRTALVEPTEPQHAVGEEPESATRQLAECAGAPGPSGRPGGAKPRAQLSG